MKFTEFVKKYGKFESVKIMKANPEEGQMTLVMGSDGQLKTVPMKK